MKNISILVLEDEPFQRLLAIAALERMGLARIHGAEDGDQALAMLQACGGVDIVLCDLRMAGMDGLAFLRHASQRGLLRAVMLASAVEPVLRQATISMIRCLGVEFLGDLGKPFDIDRATHLLRGFAPEQEQLPAAPEVIELPSLAEIAEGFERDEFEAWFQPKVDMRDGALRGAEMLARWRHPQHGFLSPAQFLPQMEASGLVDRLFWRLLDQGLAVQQQLAQEGRQVELAINIQPIQLGDRQMVERVARRLMDSGLPGEGLTFEVTETGLLRAPATSLENLVRLRLMGCGLAMDDFGAGYSSLDRLCALPFTQIKLDASFIRKLQSQPRCGAVIRSSVTLAEAMGISLVVEGVETLEQKTRLLELGCVQAQGYYFARPMEGSAFRRWIGDTRPPATTQFSP
ncbi:EAL domain-containing response regulator [Pseudomonas tohonis]|uniref:EAL domain-containing response regulator n=1 Tax=Pseudomonas tohonis TaxID=2725477 RepID=UPI0021D87F85|nr:EAL domain-containing response regulator [Pseudomonas tohonis]UXY53475.1 EAL domain-containing response regulator [Pseudomonas tohonis]